ncbi:MAG: O-antigen ligase family protein, partial [Acidimicrobiales bacterium]
MTALARRAEPVSENGHFLRRPGQLERTILFAALFTYAWGTPPEWFSFASSRAAESSPLTQALYLGFFLNTVLALNGNWHVVLTAAKREPLVPFFVAFATFSTVWSTVPMATLQQGIVLSITFVTAMHLVVRFTTREMVRMLAFVFAAGALLNLGFIAAFEGAIDSVSVAVSTEAGTGSDWRGVTTSKNTLGRSGVLGFVVCIIQARAVRSRLIWPGFAVLNAVLVLGSNSATSLGALIGISVLGVVFLGFRGRKTLYGATMVAMVVVFSALTTLAATNLVAATGLLGKDSSFTGRLPIWEDSFDYGISQRPILGHGLGGFWQHGSVDFEVQVRSRSFDVRHAHNAWIDAMLEFGPLGAILLTAIFVRGLLWSTRN